MQLKKREKKNPKLRLWKKNNFSLNYLLLYSGMPDFFETIKSLSTNSFDNFFKRKMLIKKYDVS